MHQTHPKKVNGLNPEQFEAIEHTTGPLLVLAGAGSGKTRVVTQRIVRLIEKGVSPQAILGLTFTNKAAGEMQARVRGSTNSHVLICTFHSLGARILRESIRHLGYDAHFTIYDEDDADKVLKSCLEDLAIKDDKLEPKVFRQLISRAKNALQAPENVSTENASTAEEHLPAVYRAYQGKLKQYNALDFDDLLYLTVRLFREHPDVLRHYQDRFHYLLIDEYQDTNASQYEMVRLLVGDRCNLCVVGDPDQSIYSWRGANIKNILHFEKDYPGAKIVRLEQNYRSRSNILEAANALIAHNEDRYEKNLWSDLGAGEKIQVHAVETDRNEVQLVIDAIIRHQRQGVPLNEMVIFYRTNFQSRIFEDALLARGLPYVIVGGISFYQRREIKDILGFLRMVVSDHDFISFERTINVPKRGMGPTTIDRLREGASEAGLPIFAYCVEILSPASPLPAPRLSGKQKSALTQYVDHIQQWREQRRRVGIKELVESIITGSSYGMHLADDQETLEDRWENLREFVSAAAEWEEGHPDGTLGDFLEELSLKSSLDELDESDQRVSLMTLHNGKGLEFTVSFLVGLEEELFPHVNSRTSQAALEEERRLCYVGMTRAKEYLYLSCARTRLLWGALRRMRPSRFLGEIPSEYVQKVGLEGGRTSYPRRKISFQEPTESADEPPMQEGDLVFHPEFGVGRIESAYRSSIGLTYRIHFTRDDSSVNIVAKYGKLSRLDEKP